MNIVCDYCDFRCIAYGEWIEHLVSYRHQQVAGRCINNWTEDLNARSFVLLFDGEYQKTKQDICWFFTKHGMLSDAFFGYDMEYCVIQMSRRDSILHAMAETNTLQNQSWTLLLKSDISPEEWEALFNSDTKNRHLKLALALRFISGIESQFHYFMRQITMQGKTIAARKELVKQLDGILKQTFPKCVLYPYGDDESGLENINTQNLYIYFDTFGQSNLNQQFSSITIKSQNKSEVFLNFGNALAKIKDEKGGLIYQDLTPCPNEPSQCFKFRDTVSGIQCEFSFESLLEVQLSKMLGFLTKVDPRLPHLFRFINYWAHLHKLTEPSSHHLISNSSLNLLVTVFLTKQRIIPSISVLQSMSDGRIEIDEWDASFCNDVTRISNLISFIQPSSYPIDPVTGKPTANAILDLIAEFFKFYAHSDLHSQMVCPFLGELLPKSIFKPNNESQLPKGLETYKSWARVQNSETRFNTHSPLCVQHPFDLGCNVSVNTEGNVVSNFQSFCSHAFEIIQRNLNCTNEEASLLEIFKPISVSINPSQISNYNVPQTISFEYSNLKNDSTNREYQNTSDVNGKPSHIDDSDSVAPKVVVNESEYRRLKRHRYKENLRKRQEEARLIGVPPPKVSKCRGQNNKQRSMKRLKEFREKGKKHSETPNYHGAYFGN